MAKQGNLIPVYAEFLCDTETPVSTYLKIKDKSFSYLLESADRGERWGRYSFIGHKPYLTILYRDQEMEIRNKTGNKTLNNVNDPLKVLRELSRQFTPVVVDNLSPFQGGFVGYVNYDLIRKWEHMPGISPEDKELSEAIFTVSGSLIIFDHLTHLIKVVSFAHVNEDNNLEKAYVRACEEVEQTIDVIKSPLSYAAQNNRFSCSELKANFIRQDFEDAVRKAKEYIVAGDIIQVVLSQRFSGDITGDDFTIYRNLRSINPSPYMFYLNFEKVRLIGSSPEVLVRLVNGKIELRPIAGTRQRGGTPEEDRDLEHGLLADPKERAEHIMLVDLGRNDVGRVAQPGSVKVPRLMAVERYSHVMHIVSDVEGILNPGLDGFDVFTATFPAGTVSGAPKIRAMEIISELEPSLRGPYAGGVGYFGFNNNMDFCITIRTITIVKNRLSVQVGAGIVYDSSPEGEYLETLRKAEAMFKAIERANKK